MNSDTRKDSDMLAQQAAQDRGEDWQTQTHRGTQTAREIALQHELDAARAEIARLTAMLDMVHVVVSVDPKHRDRSEYDQGWHDGYRDAMDAINGALDGDA